MNNKKFLLIVVLGTIAVFLCAKGFLKTDAVAPSGLGNDGSIVKLINKDCNALPWSEKNKIVRTNVVGKNLSIEVLENKACSSATPVTPSFKVAGNKIGIAWNWYLPPNEPVAACLCTNKIEFIVPNGAIIVNPVISIVGE